MGVHIRRFDDLSDYLDSEITIPNVSIIGYEEDPNLINFNSSTTDISNGYDFSDKKLQSGNFWPTSPLYYGNTDGICLYQYNMPEPCGYISHRGGSYTPLYSADDGEYERMASDYGVNTRNIDREFDSIYLQRQGRWVTPTYSDVVELLSRSQVSDTYDNGVMLRSPGGVSIPMVFGYAYYTDYYNDYRVHLWVRDTDYGINTEITFNESLQIDGPPNRIEPWQGNQILPVLHGFKNGYR